MPRIEGVGCPLGEVDGVLHHAAEGIVHAPRDAFKEKRVPDFTQFPKFP